MQGDQELLRQYVEDQSDAAFAELVARYVNLVYSVAMRQTSNSHHAEDITQAVFIIVSKKAGQLRSNKALGSWLFQAALLTANNFIRSEMRRQRREQEVYMQSAINELSHDELWQRISPMLDVAVASLNEKDRRAIVLRFYEGRNLSEVGVALNCNGESAKKRVARALEKLRRFFSKRGVNSSAAAFGVTIAMNSVQAAPVALAKSVTVVAVAKGLAATASISILVNGTINKMKWLKIMFAAGAGAAALIAGSVATVAVSQINRNYWQPTEQAVIENARGAYANLSSYSDSGDITVDDSGQTIHLPFDMRLQRPDLYRVNTTNGVGWRAGGEDYLKIKSSQKPEVQFDMKSGLEFVIWTIPSAFFNQNWDNCNVLKVGNPILEPSQKVNGVDCYVLSSTVLSSTSGPPMPAGKTVQKTVTTTWIGKRDYLIRQVQTEMDGIFTDVPDTSDAEIEKMLRQQGQSVTPQAIATTRMRLQDLANQTQKMVKPWKTVFTETDRDISVNKKFSVADFEEAQSP